MLQRASLRLGWSSVGRVTCRFSSQKHSNPPTPGIEESVFSRSASGAFVGKMYESWFEDPSSVNSSWQGFFSRVESGQEFEPAPLSSPLKATPQNFPGSSDTSRDDPSHQSSIADHSQIEHLVQSYQTRGHILADLDPLGIHHAYNTNSRELQLDFFGFTERDMDTKFYVPKSSFIAEKNEKLPLKEIVKRLRNTYCGHIGIEYTHLRKHEQQEWIRQRFERAHAYKLTDAEQKKLLFERLMRATKFEDFLGKKWPGVKRFGVEGCEVLIPALKEIIDVSSAHGMDSIAIAMAHRGRLNVLANVCRQPLTSILTQFATLSPDDGGIGDVKYHLGVCIERTNRRTQRPIRLSVVANPSHLEASGPVSQGKIRAEAHYADDQTGDRHMAINIHGDAAICGQGVVMETMNLSALHNYTTHGCIHIVINNQIGFTTDPRNARSTLYCTDIGRMEGVPVFHVNANDPEAVIAVARAAADYRRTFKQDVLIDLVCYRRHGHAEEDEPSFTQPLMYQRIKKLLPVMNIYQKQLMDEGVLDDKFVDDRLQEYEGILEENFHSAQQSKHIHNKDWIDSPWTNMLSKRPMQSGKPSDTGIDRENLEQIIETYSSAPEGFNVHRGLSRVLRDRREQLKQGSLNWSIGEALAYGSLLKEGVHVRVSGQDTERGAFSHRHHILHDQKVDLKTHNMLSKLSPTQATYSICNSSLSEYAVLGFELGYSMVNPHSLVVWEAQFGDFANTAQCIIDQFVSSGEAKWNRQSGLVMLLPHGYEGMGPEHSSARPERFLQMCNEECMGDLQHEKLDGEFVLRQLELCNWIIVNCTTPANFFHVLRRQLALPFRKPLIVLAPKSLLRHPMAKSPVEDFLSGTSFKRVLPDCGVAGRNPLGWQQVKRLIFCSGELYYDIVSARKEAGIEEQLSVVRVEQLSPFPYDAVGRELAKYGCQEVVWAQAEPKNMGAWEFVQPRLTALLSPTGRVLHYAGRKRSDAVATGNKYLHEQEQAEVIAEAIGRKCQ